MKGRNLIYHNLSRIWSILLGVPPKMRWNPAAWLSVEWLTETWCTNGIQWIHSSYPPVAIESPRHQLLCFWGVQHSICFLTGPWIPQQRLRWLGQSLYSICIYMCINLHASLCFSFPHEPTRGMVACKPQRCSQLGDSSQVGTESHRPTDLWN